MTIYHFDGNKEEQSNSQEHGEHASFQGETITVERLEEQRSQFTQTDYTLSMRLILQLILGPLCLLLSLLWSAFCLVHFALSLLLTAFTIGRWPPSRTSTKKSWKRFSLGCVCCVAFALMMFSPTLGAVFLISYLLLHLQNEPQSGFTQFIMGILQEMDQRARPPQ